MIIEEDEKEEEEQGKRPKSNQASLSNFSFSRNTEEKRTG